MECASGSVKDVCVMRLAVLCIEAQDIHIWFTLLLQWLRNLALAVKTLGSVYGPQLSTSGTHLSSTKLIS